MVRFSRSFFRLFLVAASALYVTPTQAQTPVVSTFARLGGTSDGYHPFNGLVAGSDGAFYGTTEAGGLGNCGTVYRVSSAGTLTTLHAFTGGDGANPQAALIDGGDGFFYGTTQNGGANGTGTLFKISAAGAFTSLHSLDAVNAMTNNNNAEGAFPQAALVSGGDGYFYGAAFAGGASGNGTVFRISPAGAFNVVHVFTSTAEGTNPAFALTSGGDGSLYGTTSSGGAGSGVIYKVSTSGDYQVITSYPASGGSRVSAGSPLVFSGGRFYGLGQGTYGTSSDIFYAVTAAGALTTLHPFTSTEGTLSASGPSYRSGLSLGADGNLYAAAPRGGAGNDGAVLRLTPAGTLTTLHAFTGTDGLYPTGAPVPAADGSIYGVTAGTPNAGFGAGGTVYRIESAGEVTTLRAFTPGGSSGGAGLVEGTDGNFYGVTQGGGAKNGGTAFALDASGHLLGTHDCDPDVDGRGPNARLIDGGNGSFYGTTAGDGPDGIGTVYQLTPSHPSAQTSARTLQESAGGEPRVQNPGLGDIVFGWLCLPIPPRETDDPSKPLNPKGVTLHRPAAGASRAQAEAFDDSTLYGVFQAGATGNGGALFSLTLGGSLTLLHEFGADGNDGKLPYDVVQAANGDFYGATYGGGTAGVGTIFKYAADGTYSVLYSFKGAGDGAFPLAGLTAGTDGDLYGTTSVTSYDKASFNQTGSGTIFKITPAGAFTTLHVLSNNAYVEGYQPMAALVQASDGKLYGTTSSAGPSGGYGTVFSITPDGTFATVAGFNGFQDGGTSPRAPLIQATDGNLYGVTSSGGTDNAGVVFKVDLNAAGATVPTVTLTAAVSTVTVGSGQNGEFLLTLPSAATSDIHVAYAVKGSALAGIDYVILKGTAKIKAGKTSKPIKIKPLGDLDGAGKKTVKLVLEPGTGYTVGTTGKVKVSILAGQ